LAAGLDETSNVLAAVQLGRRPAGTMAHALVMAFTTLEGSEDAGPTLAQAAQLLQQLGLRDALNLDGGSSTGLVMGGTMPVMGRGVVGAVHHGLGLVP
jgi:exopolysaccharide biosynthesis protein